MASGHRGLVLSENETQIHKRDYLNTPFQNENLESTQTLLSYNFLEQLQKTSYIVL
jgi:hypothetical protein